jgi:hypothetical protein
LAQRGLIPAVQQERFSVLLLRIHATVRSGSDGWLQRRNIFDEPENLAPPKAYELSQILDPQSARLNIKQNL